VVTLADPVQLSVPDRTAIQPVAPVDDVMLVPPDPTPTRTFQLQSRGGYLRTVTGRVAYLDAEAHTLVVQTSDGHLSRVSLREIQEPVAPVRGTLR
jgi:hypothetical protein